MIVHIQVTAADVAAGQRGNCSKCPIALAINRALKPGYWASLERRTISINYSERDITQQIGVYPGGLVDRVNSFDKTGSMEPFTFPMDICDRLIVGI